MPAANPKNLLLKSQEDEEEEAQLYLLLFVKINILCQLSALKSNPESFFFFSFLFSLQHIL